MCTEAYRRSDWATTLTSKQGSGISGHMVFKGTEEYYYLCHISQLMLGQCWVPCKNLWRAKFKYIGSKNVFHNQIMLVRNSLENVFNTSIGICRNGDLTVLNSCNSLNFKSKNNLKRRLFWSQDNNTLVICILLPLFSSCFFSKTPKNSLCKGLWFCKLIVVLLQVCITACPIFPHHFIFQTVICLKIPDGSDLPVPLQH